MGALFLCQKTSGNKAGLCGGAFLSKTIQFNQKEDAESRETRWHYGPVVLYAPTAKDFQGIAVQPGRQALIIAQNEPYMAHKVADGMGMVQTTLYRIEQVTETDINSPAQEYATKGELAQLQQIVQQIVDSIAPKKTAKKEAASE